MKTIHKYPLNQEVIQLPVGAQILSVQLQEATYFHSSQLVLWALVDTDKPLENRTINIFATGQALEQITGDKYNDYDGLYYDMELIGKSLNKALALTKEEAK